MTQAVQPSDFRALPSAQRQILTGFSEVLYRERRVKALQPGEEALSKVC